jgi:AcrR family transcriptional regulator
LTFTVEARRAQFIGLTIKIIAEHGYGGCSLQRIADAAGVTKAAVIYHFSSKNAVVRAAYDAVIADLTGHVGTLVDAAADPAGAVEGYVRGMTGYMAEHPGHVRVIVEALTEGGVPDHNSPARWQALAALLGEACPAGTDTRTLAIVIGGAIDGLISEFLDDPSFDPRAGAEALLTLLNLRQRR